MSRDREVILDLWDDEPMEHATTGHASPPEVSYRPKAVLHFSDTPYSLPPQRPKYSSQAVERVGPSKEPKRPERQERPRQERTTPPVPPQLRRDDSLRDLPPTRPALKAHLEVLPQSAASYPPPYKDHVTQEELSPPPQSQDISAHETLRPLGLSSSMAQQVDPHESLSLEEIEPSANHQSDFLFDFEYLSHPDVDDAQPPVDMTPNPPRPLESEREVPLRSSPPLKRRPEHSNDFITSRHRSKASPKEGLDMLVEVDQKLQARQHKLKARFHKLKQQREEMFDAYYDRLNQLEETLDKQLETSQDVHSDKANTREQSVEPLAINQSSRAPLEAHQEISRPLTQLPSSQKMINHLFSHLNEPSLNQDHSADEGQISSSTFEAAPRNDTPDSSQRSESHVSSCEILSESSSAPSSTVIKRTSDRVWSDSMRPTEPPQEELESEMSDLKPLGADQPDLHQEPIDRSSLLLTRRDTDRSINFDVQNHQHKLNEISQRFSSLIAREAPSPQRIDQSPHQTSASPIRFSAMSPIEHSGSQNASNFDQVSGADSEQGSRSIPYRHIASRASLRRRQQLAHAFTQGVESFSVGLLSHAPTSGALALTRHRAHQIKISIEAPPKLKTLETLEHLKRGLDHVMTDEPHRRGSAIAKYAHPESEQEREALIEMKKLLQGDRPAEKRGVSSSRGSKISQQGWALGDHLKQSTPRALGSVVERQSHTLWRVKSGAQRSAPPRSQSLEHHSDSISITAPSFTDTVSNSISGATTEHTSPPSHPPPQSHRPSGHPSVKVRLWGQGNQTDDT